MCPSVYWPPTIMQVVVERRQFCLELLGFVVFFALADVWQRRRRLGRLTDNRRDLLLTVLAYCSAWASIFVMFFALFIWDDALSQHENMAFDACAEDFQAVYQAYHIAGQVEFTLMVFAGMLLALAALLTILRGVVAQQQNGGPPIARSGIMHMTSRS